METPRQSQEKIRKRAAKQKAFLDALYSTLGVVSQACRASQISRGTYYKWMEEDEEFARKVEDLGEVALDFVESNLFKQIKKGVPGSTIFYLKTKGKKRGYVEKSQVEIIEENKFADLTDEELKSKLANLKVIKGGQSTGTNDS